MNELKAVGLFLCGYEFAIAVSPIGDSNRAGVTDFNSSATLMFVIYQPDSTHQSSRLDWTLACVRRMGV
jgi:hypothetical protein